MSSVERLRSQPVDVLCPQLRDPITAEVLDAGLPRLRCVSLYAVGYNNVDVDAATERRIAVSNTPGVLTDATADCAMALLLAAARRICEGDAAVRAGTFTGWEPDYLLGMELNGATLGVVGFGRIGQAVARRALGFGMRVEYSTDIEVDIDERPHGPRHRAPAARAAHHRRRHLPARAADRRPRTTSSTRRRCAPCAPPRCSSTPHAAR